MSGISQIEAAIQALPADEFFSLLGWMSDRHLEVLASGEFESPALEAELLKSLESPRHLVNDAFFADIRSRASAAQP